MPFRDIQSHETIPEPFQLLLLQNMHLRGPFLEIGCAEIPGNDDEDTSLLLERLVSSVARLYSINSLQQLKLSSIGL
jgi:hypothetical protein